MTPVRYLWAWPVAWLVMARETSRRERREITRPNGSAPQPVRTTFPDSSVVAGHNWWLAVAVVAGLFAMHGLGMHALHPGEPSSAMHSESISSAPAMSATGYDDGTAVLAVPLTAVLGVVSLGSATDKSPEPSGGAVLLGLCLTLLAFGVLWLRRWTRGRPAWTVPRRALTARVARLSVTARDLSPPLRAELSIWRC